MVHHTLLILWRSKSHGVRYIAFYYEDMILKMEEKLDKWRASSIEYRDQPGREPSLGLGILLQTPQIIHGFSQEFVRRASAVLQEYLRLNPD